MKVIGWDGFEKEVNDRNEAVETVKKYLADWMEPKDHITWFKRLQADEFPTIAYVITSCGEPTDASAVIVG